MKNLSRTGFHTLLALCLFCLVAIGANAQQDPWQHIDLTSSQAKLVSSPVPYHVIIPAGILVGGGGLVLVLVLSSKDSTPDPPIEEPQTEDPPFVLLNDIYSVNCGQSLLISPLQNDVGTGLNITAIIGAPEGVELINNTTITIPSTLSGDVSFSIAVEDVIGQTGTSTVSVVVEEIEIVANGDVFNLEAGETVTGNVLSNDLCLSCEVTNTEGTTGILEMAASGEFEYTAPEGFSGEALYTITIENPCGTQDTSSLIFNVQDPSCSFDWQGLVSTEPSACGLETGTAFATQELLGPYNFAWSNGVEGVENSNLSAGEYQLFVTDTLTGCTDTLNAVVNELAPDYDLDFEILPGECGATDNVQLFSNADIDQPLTITLSGTTEGIIENVTSPDIVLGDFVVLNPGDLTITVWSVAAGPECAQTINTTMNQAPEPGLTVLDTGPELIVLEIVDVVFPVEIFVNGEPYVLANESPAFIEGLPPGEYEIFVVDDMDCMSPIVMVILEGGVQNTDISTLRWSPQNQSSINWINTPQHLLLNTQEGLDAFYPVGTPTALPVVVGIEHGNWVASFVFSSASYQQEGFGHSEIRRINYSEWNLGNRMNVFGQEVTVSIGYADWKSNGSNLNANGWFADGLIACPLKGIHAEVQLGLRTGFINGLQQLIVLPKIQCTFSK